MRDKSATYDGESFSKRSLKMKSCMKVMAESDKFPQIDPAKTEILIEKIEQKKLKERERLLIAALLRSFLYESSQLQEKKITLYKLKEMIFGREIEKRKREKEKPGGGEKDTTEGALCRSCTSLNSMTFSINVAISNKAGGRSKTRRIGS